MTLTPNELLAMVAKINERPMPSVQEDNWDELESDDGHLELYLDNVDEQMKILGVDKQTKAGRAPKTPLMGVKSNHIYSEKIPDLGYTS